MKKILTTFTLSIAGSFFGGYVYALNSDGATGLNWELSLLTGILLWGLVLLRDRSIFSIVKR